MINIVRELYKIVSIAPNEKLLREREDFVQQVTSSLSTADGLDLVRVYLGGHAHDANFISRFTRPLSLTHNIFSEGEREFEVRVLAAATLVCAMQNSNASSDAVALALLCSDGLEQCVPLVPNIRSFAFDYIQCRGIGLRLPAKVQSATTTRPLTVLQLLQEMENSAATAPIDKASITELLSKYKQESIQAEANIKLFEIALENSHKDKMPFEEEIMLLKMLVADQLDERENVEANTKAAIVCISIAKQFYDAMKWCIPHPHTMAMIMRLLRSQQCDTVLLTIADVAASARFEWFTSLNIDAVADFCPIIVSASLRFSPNQKGAACQFDYGLSAVTKRHLPSFNISYRALLELLLAGLLKD